MMQVNERLGAVPTDDQSLCMSQQRGISKRVQRKLDWAVDMRPVDGLARCVSEPLSAKAEPHLRRTVSSESLHYCLTDSNKENLGNLPQSPQPRKAKPQLSILLDSNHPCHPISSEQTLEKVKQTSLGPENLEPSSPSCSRAASRSPVVERRMSKRLAPYPPAAPHVQSPPTKPRHRVSSLLSPLSMSTPSIPFCDDTPALQVQEEARPSTSPSPLSQSSFSPKKEGPLPTLASSAICDLASISPETTANLVSGHYADSYEHIIVDCRFPYEFDGGHINGAVNLQTPQELEETFLRTPMNGGKVIIVFHCEFSSHRGPTLCRLLRKMDRARNSYPNLFYPHVYLLQGGYKHFYERFQQLCNPQQYVTMNDSRFSQEMKRALESFRRNTNQSKMKRSQSMGCITALLNREEEEPRRPSSLRSKLSMSMVDFEQPPTPTTPTPSTPSPLFEPVCAEDTPDSKYINREVQRLTITVTDEHDTTTTKTTTTINGFPYTRLNF